MLFTTKEYLGRDIVDDVILSETIDKKIICRSVFTGKKLWEYPLKKYGTYIQNEKEYDMNLSEIYGIHNNLLYLKIGTKIILGIDIEKGDEVFRYDYAHNSGGLMNTKLDKKTNQIFSIGPKHYIEINLSTGNSRLFDISSSVKEHEVEPYRLGSWQNNEIYFYEGGFDNCKFGVFSRSKKTIVWSAEVTDKEGKNYPIKDVKHSDNKLYAHDKNNTLHIFEREKFV